MLGMAQEQQLGWRVAGLAWGGGLVGTPWSLDRQHLPHTKTSVPNTYKNLPQILFLTHNFDKDGSFTERVCLGPQPQKEKSQAKMVTTNWLWESSAVGRFHTEGGKSCLLFGLQVHVWVYFEGGWSELLEWWLYFSKSFINWKTYPLDILFKLNSQIFKTS